MRRFSFSLFATVLAGTLLLSACSEQQTHSLDPNPVMSVTLVAPSQSMWPHYVQASGEVQAWQYANVASALSGIKLTDVLVEVGDTVAKGQMLARFEQADIKADLASAQAELIQAKANYRIAKQQAQRSNTLIKQKLISTEQHLSDQANADIAQAKITQAQANVEYQTLRMTRTELMAPDSGIISQRDAQIGQVPSVGTPLFQLIRQQKLQWQGELSAAQLAQVQLGQSVTLHWQNSIITGEVYKIAPTLNSDTLTTLVYVNLPPNTGLKAGMYLGGKIILGQSQALHVPESALVLRDGYEYVLTVNSTQHVQMQKVSTGRRHNNSVEITSGLTSHTQVIEAGGAFLNQGDLVTLVAHSGAQGAQ